MEAYFCINLLLLYFASVSSSPINYVYNENPDLGYIAAISGPLAYTKTKLNGPKKYFVGNSNQKYMKLVNEEAIDSLFSVRRNYEKPFSPTIEISNVIDPKIVEISDQQHHNTPDDGKITNQNKVKGTPDSNIKETQKSKEDIKPVSLQYEYHSKQDNFRKANINLGPKSQFDFKQSTIRKPQYSIQKYNDKPMNIGNKDKPVNKVNNNKRNNQVMENMLNDMTQKAIDIYEQKQENRKRETMPKIDKDESILPEINMELVKQHNVKFIDNKGRVPARIGKYDESVNGQRPYALFYRGLENIDHRDFYTGSVDDNSMNDIMDIAINIKDKTKNIERNRKARKISNVKLNRNNLDTDLIL